MVRQWQELFYNRHYSNSCLMRDKTCPPQCSGPTKDCPKYYLPDFVKLAEAYGAVGIRITKPEEVEPAIRKAIEIPCPVIMDFIIEREENVFPMIAPGAPVDQMIGGD
jgi:acetolactate synthase-1/2/3 large subunit